MQEFILDKDIHVLCVTATTFPEGIMPAFSKLHALLPDADKRDAYGISHGGNSPGSIIYRAGAAMSTHGEAEEYGLEEFTIKAGKYIGTMLKDWKQDETIIGRTFQKLLSEYDIDPNGACIEKYLDENDVQCMVRLKDNIA